jgi:leader peptidase (prepilin peptidase)/N-methyltransferase
VIVLLVAWSAVFGAVIGSFLNVVIYRVPAGLSIAYPASACPCCHTPILRRDNIPVLSWVGLRGRCRTCQEPISRRCPVVEALTATLFAMVALHFGVTWATPAFWLFAAVGVALSVIDLLTHRLPDPIVGFAYASGSAALLAASAAGAGDGPEALGRAGIGAAALYCGHLVAMLIYPAGMGFGDVKLAGVTGMFLAWVGWGPLVVGVASSFVVGLALAGVLALVQRGKVRGVPFGPAMFIGAGIGVAAGQPLWTAYLAVLGF